MDSGVKGIKLIDMDITLDNGKFCAFDESCNLSKPLETKVKSYLGYKNTTALIRLFLWETLTWSN